jgi:hypothetical protein
MGYSYPHRKSGKHLAVCMRDYDLIPLGDSVFYGNVSKLVGMHVFAFSSLFL